MKDLSAKNVFFTILGMSIITSFVSTESLSVNSHIRIYQALVLIPVVFTLIYSFKYFNNISFNHSIFKDEGFFKLLSLITLSLILFPKILSIALSKF